MSREPRLFQPGVVYHLISRFIVHEWFITSDRERTLYLKLLARSLSRTDWRCLSYAIMSSHIHLAMVAGRDALHRWIRRVHTPFANTINAANGRIGALFVRGPRDIRIPDDRVGSLLAYIHNNPVRAGVTPSAAESDWTSHRAYLDLVRRPDWLHVDEGLSRAGFSTAQAFDEFTRCAPPDPMRDVLGRAQPAENEDTLEQPKAPRTQTVPASEVIEVVAEISKISVASLHSRRKGAIHVQARRAAVCCGDALGISGSAMARALGISQQRVSAILIHGTADNEVDDLVAATLRRIEQP